MAKKYKFIIKWMKFPIQGRKLRYRAQRKVQNQIFDLMSAMFFDASGLETSDMSKEEKKENEHEVIWQGSEEDMKKYKSRFENLDTEKLFSAMNKWKRYLSFQQRKNIPKQVDKPIDKIQNYLIAWGIIIDYGVTQCN